MFLFCWYFDFLCKFKIFNEPWYIDKISFLLYFIYFFSCKTKDWILRLAYASQFMQNIAVDSLLENIKTKIVIKFHFINFMTYLARVADSMVIFSASLWFRSSHYIQYWSNWLTTVSKWWVRDNGLTSATALRNKVIDSPQFHNVEWGIMV